METTTSTKQLRTRFVSDYNFPIQIMHSPYFEDRLDLLENEYGAKTAYDSVIQLINNRFNGNSDNFLAYYRDVRDKIITSVIESDAYKDFISNNEYIKSQTPICGAANLYTNEQDGGLFISFDMKKANFQTLRYANPSIVLNANTYEEFIGKFTDLDYIKQSKYTRQVIFGKMNPKRTIILEKWITTEFAKFVLEHYPALKEQFTLFSLVSDEIIFKFNGTQEDFEKIDLDRNVIFNGIEFRLNKFKLHARHFKLATSSSMLTVYEKEDYLNGHHMELKCVPVTYFPQVYKLLHGIELNHSDLMFYYEHELCQFINQLELIK